MSKTIIAVIILGISLFLLYRNMQNSKAADLNQAKGQAFLETNKQKDGVLTTESGLQYEIVHKSESGEKPTPAQRVKVHYHGTLIDGTVFDSSVDRGTPIDFGVTQVIKGWQEGLQLMDKGDKYRFYIPAQLGYGNRGTGPIPPASVLIFDVELIDIL
ncbi:FKBP-type peptidyl-prolyl cis-trans isomerase [Vibrio agarivorans]|uniref:Peptidyl-prolyl cis-trans isomerase n=1 Tax=Vibrio agarivorans TaxID=153622 RepID=A0ABT7Y671_9VIBR|nr:FKBP-type peptidyl-prolyl cis-trans isomerase [Vibrio agarivorans]MDN2483229.1 FKBP-type peptidyl-prolyl cis-trans isomerase [Vibrio agarivorans]